MIAVHSRALKKSISIDRILGHIKGKEPGATVILLGGVHGNEPSGVFALSKVMATLEQKQTEIKGNIYAIAGNLPALEKEIRYNKEDLNRIWNDAKIKETITAKHTIMVADTQQLLEIYEIVTEILKKESGPFYFVDLHTTSGKTKPFITVNDNLLNRKFTQQYPVPLLLGIEEYLEGTFLSYINALGYVAFGFESGQHDAVSSIENHIAFVYLSLVFAGNLPTKELDFDSYYDLLEEKTQTLDSCYEIVYHYKIRKNENFNMLPGLENFELVQKGQNIALSDEKSVKVSESGNIFMPLYQAQGEDGFFIIKSVQPFFLVLSAILRKLHVDYLLPFLPGISWASKEKDSLTVNLKIVRFFAKNFFHLLGYRNRQIGATRITISNREASARNKEYIGTWWYK